MSHLLTKETHLEVLLSSDWNSSTLCRPIHRLDLYRVHHLQELDKEKEQCIENKGIQGKTGWIWRVWQTLGASLGSHNSM